MASVWQRMRGLWIGLAAFTLTGGAMLLLAEPVHAQYSDGYTFLKAVRDRDGGKATPLLDRPGTVVVNTRDPTTGESALHVVVRGRDPVWTRYLIGKGADVNARDNAGETPLLAAVRIGWDEGVDILLGRRAAVNQANGRGETPLIVAVQSRNLPVVRALLTAGADPKLADRQAGLSARDYAERDGRSAAIVKLIDETKPAAAARPVAGPR